MSSPSYSRLDFFARKAKREGYPARSVYKLQEIDKRWSILRRGDAVIDMGAAPGGWSLYARKKTGRSGRVLSVDIQPFVLQEAPGQDVLVGDIFDVSLVEHLLREGPFNVVLSDMAPASTGQRLVDAAASYTLSERVITLLEPLLKKGGHAVVKIFQGGDEKVLSQKMERLFSQTYQIRPKATRSSSFEIYFVGRHFLV